MKTITTLFLLLTLDLLAQDFDQLTILTGVALIEPEANAYETYHFRFNGDVEHLEDILGQDRDFPAQLIPIDPKKYPRAWQQKWSPPNREASYYDHSTLLELNVTAARIWKKMVECQAGRYDQARIAYFRGQVLCAGDKESNGDEILEDLYQYHRQVYEFVATSNVYSPSFHQQVKKNLNFKSYPKNIYDYNQSANVLPEVHPLFTQVLLEIMAVYYPFVSVWPKMDHRPVFDRVDDLIYGGILNDPNYIETASSGKYYERAERLGRLLLRQLGHNIELRGKKVATEEELLRAKIIHNISFLFFHMPLGKCYEWGLWPGITTSLSFFISDLDHPVFIRNLRAYFPMGILARKVRLSCGDLWDAVSINKTQHSKFYIRGLPWALNERSYLGLYLGEDQYDIGNVLVSAFRQMAEHYLD